MMIPMSITVSSMTKIIVYKQFTTLEDAEHEGEKLFPV